VASRSDRNPGARAGWSAQRRDLRPVVVALALLAAALVALPIAGVFGSVFYAPGSLDTLLHLGGTVIPRAALETGALVLLVMAGVIVLGTTSAWLVAAHDFPGRRIFEWALLLPLAMPGYIVAYAYTDFLQFSGPVQGALRDAFGWQRGDYWFPEIRSLPGAAFVFAVVLYPYVYLLARTAFLSRTASMIDAARSLGLSPWRTWLHVNLPLARPAVAAGALLALMETLADYGAAAYFGLQTFTTAIYRAWFADYGAAAYFGLQTFTTAIYRAWFALGDRLAASQLAAVLLLLVLLVMATERHLRGRARYFAAPNSRSASWRRSLACCRCWRASCCRPASWCIFSCPPWARCRGRATGAGWPIR